MTRYNTPAVYLKPALLGLFVAFAYLVLVWSGLTANLFSFASRESSIYRGMADGLASILILGPLGAMIAGGVGALSQANYRFRSALASMSAYVIVVIVAFVSANQIRRNQTITEHEERRQSALVRPSQEAQSLPLLDEARPITILNQIGLGRRISLKLDTPYQVRAKVRDEVASQHDTVIAALTVTVPGSAKREVIGRAILRPIAAHSVGTRRIFEGSISFAETFGATEALLDVTGESDIFDVVKVELDVGNRQ